MQSTLLVHDLRPLSEREAEVYIASTCFKTGPPERIGAELERLVYDEADPRLPVPASRVRRALTAVGSPLPQGGLVSLEPGGQPELSTLPASDLPELIDVTRRDLATIDTALAAAGLRPGCDALDALRPPHRTLDLPRYAAMQQYFDRQGPAGHTMMCSTTALQVCLDAGLDGSGPDSALQRWHRLHLLAPVLIAMFANSPFSEGAPSGWRSGRQAVWLAMDPARTRPPALDLEPRAAWTHYVLEAPLLCLTSESARWQVPTGLTMRGWLRGHGPRPPTMADLDYHVTTLFPPVRPRGFLEFRVLDAQAATDWEVAVAVVAALMADGQASDRASDACEPVRFLRDPMTRRRPRRAREPGARQGGPCVCRGRPRRPPRPGSRRPHPRASGRVRRALHRAGTVSRRRPGRPLATDRTPRPVRRRGDDMTSNTDRRTATLGPGELEGDALKARIADDLERARRRTLALTSACDEADVVKQHSALMSPLVWDLAHVGNQEELWLVRDVGAMEPLRCDIDQLYDAFKHPRGDRPALPLLSPRESRSYIAGVRDKALDVLDATSLEGRALVDKGFVFGMVAQHEQQHDETMMATHQLRDGEPVLHAEAPAADVLANDAERLPSEVLVPAGPFTMGTSMEPWALDNERPAHEVDVPAYWIDTVPVTNGAYRPSSRTAATTTRAGGPTPAGGIARRRVWSRRCSGVPTETAGCAPASA